MNPTAKLFLSLGSISGVKILGAITPIGGLCFIAGWGLLAIAAMKTTG